MTKQRIKLSARQVQQDKARAVEKARNGAINKCMKIFRKHIEPHTSYIMNHNRAIIPYSVIQTIKNEMKELKK